MARGQIADPEFAAKAADGRPVRTCVGCKQECVGRVRLNRWLGCRWSTRGPGTSRAAAGSGGAGLRVVRPHTAGIVGEHRPRRHRVGGEPGALEVTLLHHPTGAIEHRRVDAVVASLCTAPCDRLSTTARDLPLHRIGDCLAPRRIDAAVREGERVVPEIEAGPGRVTVCSSPT